MGEHPGRGEAARHPGQAGIFDWGSDFGLETNPFEVTGLERLVEEQDAGYIGKTALERIRREGVSRKLVGIEIEGEPVDQPTQHWPVSQAGRTVGHVTDACWSPRLEKNIGYVWVPIGLAAPGTRLDVQADDGSRVGVTASIPFIDPNSRSPRPERRGDVSAVPWRPPSTVSQLTSGRPWQDAGVRSIDVVERGARLARRHRLAAGHRAGDVEEAAESMVCLHATDPATVYLSAWARVDDLTVPDLERALYIDRSLVKHLAMRRTLFVFTRATLSIAQAGASNRVADGERRRLIRDVEKAGLQRNGERWLSKASEQVLAALSDGREATSSELRNEISSLEGSIAYGEGKSWGGNLPVGPRVLTTLSAAGRIVRASNDGGWTTSRPRWTATATWLGEEIAPVPEAEGVAGLVERWLHTFGPGTVADIKWWLGSTVAATRRALADLDAVEVDLDGHTGYLLPDDLEAAAPVEPWAALLPPLDPTTMGWFERDWYLGPYKADLFDTNGNAGPTAWWDGRIVGGWRQTDSGEVDLQLLEGVGRAGQRALEDEATRLTEWLGGTRVLARFPSPLSKRIAGSTIERLFGSE